MSTEKLEDIIIVVSPLQRTLQTITPYLETILDKKQLKNLNKKYLETQKIYQDIRDKKEIQKYIKDPKAQKLFQLETNVYMDFRITDVITPELQDKVRPEGLTRSKPTNENLTVK
ncbi:hypothetical protein KKH82_04215 [Patescibacteria group bacterium]|nr:hypothetical protein [Patescibacteria group bacterium]